MLLCAQCVQTCNYYFSDGLSWSSCLEDLSPVGAGIYFRMEQESVSSCRADIMQGVAWKDLSYEGWWWAHLCSTRRQHWSWLLVQGSSEWTVDTQGTSMEKLLPEYYYISVDFSIQRMFSPTWSRQWWSSWFLMWIGWILQVEKTSVLPFLW